MPKDEFDPEDPLELNGVALLTSEDTQLDMAECFVEEFMRLGHDPDAILALFRNPHYIGTHMVLENQGEVMVRQIIEDVFLRWGRTVNWKTSAPQPREAHPQPPVGGPAADVPDGPTDPMGIPVPQIS